MPNRSLSLNELDDSLTSSRFTTRTEQPSKCCEQLQKRKVGLGLGLVYSECDFFSSFFFITPSEIIQCQHVELYNT